MKKNIVKGIANVGTTFVVDIQGLLNGYYYGYDRIARYPQAWV